MSVESASHKRKRLSKNKKKSWRKTDIEDVEEYLEDQRLQERTGGLVAEKSDDQLFFVDTAPPTEDTDNKVTASGKRRGQKPLKCQALLEPDPNIKPARVKHNFRQDGLHRRCTALQDKVKQGVLSATEKQAKQQSKDAAKHRQKRLKKDTDLPTFSEDLWGDAPKRTEKDVDEHYLRQTRQTRIVPPAHYTKKPSVMPSLELPHPGSSYNPCYDDHQGLLQEALDVEVMKEKKELKLKRAVEIPKKTLQQVQSDWLSEMSAGINDKDQEGEDSGSEPDDINQLSVNPPVRRENKKTEQQRRKIKERKAKAKEVRLAKVDKLRKQEVFKLKNIKKEVRERQQVLQEQKAVKADKRTEKEGKTKKLGKLKYEAPDIDIKLSDELVGTLRHLKPEGSLMYDRFKNYQKRNIIEPRTRSKFVRRYKQKKYMKKSHKDVV